MIALLASTAPGCVDGPAEIMIVLESDLAVPKDIEQVSIEIVTGGEVQFASDFPTAGDALQLPATLGVVVHDPTALVTFRATALKGGVPRVTRQAVTRATEGAVGMLRLPLSWFCDGVVCPGGEANPADLQTCHEGACVPAFVPPADLPDYAPEDVFGGGDGSGDGTCFSVTDCFALPVPRFLDAATCRSVGVRADLATAVQTEGDGVCNQQGCFVPLPASMLSTALAEDTSLALPTRICDRTGTTQALGVAQSTSCGPWAQPHPLCGPWAPTAGPALDPVAPVTLAAGQRHPQALVLHGEHVYWTNAGSGAADGEIKRTRREGGTPERLASDQIRPAGLTVIDPGGGDALRVAWLSEGERSIFSVPVGSGLDPLLLPRLLAEREGTRGALAQQGGRIHWTTSLGFVMALPVGGGAPEAFNLDAQDPTAIVAVADAVLWLDRTNRRIWARAGSNAPAPVVFTEGNAGILAADATHVYWTVPGTLGSTDGKVMRARWQGGNDGTTQEIAGGEDYPYAIAVGGAEVYWTTWGQGRIRSTLTGGGTPKTLATGEPHPMAISVDASHVYWLSAGTSGAAFADGALRRVSRGAQSVSP
ncbi:hypothetical protein [Chondromyces apiculatus]|nr:hypothetical protein [Chondromyces apiculatus]